MTPHNFATNIQRAYDAQDHITRAIKELTTLQSEPSPARKIALTLTHLETAFLWLDHWIAASDMSPIDPRARR